MIEKKSDLRTRYRYKAHSVDYKSMIIVSGF